jgi:hypothetical protein
LATPAGAQRMLSKEGMAKAGYELENHQFAISLILMTIKFLELSKVLMI